jgi:hypothetical protein
MPDIKVRYSSIDGVRKSRKFKSVASASKFARYYVGDHPDIGPHYAVASDGIGKVEVEGATFAELFPSREQAKRVAELEQVWKATHRDYKGRDANGVRSIMVFRNGSVIVPLYDLTDKEIADRLPKAKPDDEEGSEAPGFDSPRAEWSGFDSQEMDDDQ